MKFINKLGSLIILFSIVVGFQGPASSTSIVDLEGHWTNNYGSLMKLQYDPLTGMILGNYSSSTGSTGIYRIIGAAMSNVVADDKGLPVALSIWWHDTSGGDRDPSWHWVSGLAGSYYKETGQLLFRHRLVTTNSFVGISSGNLTLTDKLTYVKTGSINSGDIPDYTYTDTLKRAINYRDNIIFLIEHKSTILI